MKKGSFLELNKKVLVNIVWLFFDKIVKLALSLIFIVSFARYLGPEQFGIYSYSLSVVIVFTSITSLGLKNIVVKLLLRQHDKPKVLLGTAFTLLLVSGLLIYILLIFYALAFETQLTKLVLIILGGTLVFKAMDVTRFYFESIVKSKYSVFVDNLVFVVFVLIKLFLITQDAPLEYFAYIAVIESIIVFFGLFYIFRKKISFVEKWEFELNTAFSLLKQSWPLIISSACWILYTRIDQLMIGKILNADSVGVYAVAAQFSDVIIFIPSIIVFSMVPSIEKYRNIDLAKYNQSFQNIYDISISIMIVLALAISMFSELLINMLFGDGFSLAAEVLIFHIWSSVFVSMALVSGQYLVYEGKQKITMYRHFFGVIINIILNCVLIPEMGIKGAAIATLASLFICNYLLDITNETTRICFYHKTKGVFSLGFINILREKYEKKHAKR